MRQAVIVPLGAYVPVKELEIVDEKQDIWKGKIVDSPDKNIEAEYVFFSRRYLTEVNDLDRIFPEISFDESINGEPFILVPKEKLLFGYFPPSTIHIPSPQSLQRKHRRMQ